MGKNIIVLGMSTLPGQGRNLQECTCYWNFNGHEDEVKYYSQLEPISKMIKKELGSLDKIVILATKETKDKVKIKYENKDNEEGENQGEEMSAVEFYLHRMGIEDGKNVEIIDVDNENPVSAINKSVTIIRDFWKDNKDSEPKLWIDTQGGFRNMNLVVNAIISLLKGEYKGNSNGIIPSGIYYIKFNYNRERKYPIEDQTNTYKIFDFVSGINEFLRYGRAEQLEDYYKGMKEGKEPKVIGIMKDIAESIQMCDMNGFDNNIKKLRTYINQTNEHDITGNDELLSIFWNTIKEDYGPLLKNTCTELDIVRWFYKKKFYQQSITYIESKMPYKWYKKRIIRYKIYDNDNHEDKNNKVLNQLRESLHIKKNNTPDINIIINQLIIGLFERCSIVDIKEKCGNFNNLSSSIKEEYRAASKKINLDVKYDKEPRFGYMTVYISPKEKYNDVMNMLFMYMLLKKERNNFNHMSDSNKRANQKELGEAISKFIEIGSKVYGTEANK